MTTHGLRAEVERILAANPGAQWRRIDLHLHSPASCSFTCPDGTDPMTAAGREAIAHSYVDQMVKSGLELVALTDYNQVSPVWYPLLHDLAAKRSISLLPGVEIALAQGKHGLHLIVVFGTDCSVDGVNRFLASLDVDPATPLVSGKSEHRKIRLRSDLGTAVRSLRDTFHPLVIVPHPDEDNGLCKTWKAKDAADVLKQVDPDAIEHCPEDEYKRLEAFLGTGFFRVLARVEFSDPKSIADIGTKKRADGTPRGTYLKLSAMDLDALRLALHDPETRLQVGHVRPADWARIVGIDVEGSGFLGNLTARLSDSLNTIIGGRGAGKSALLEVLRYALDVAPYADADSRQDLVRHALGSGGKVAVLLERPTGTTQAVRYVVTRILGQDPRVEKYPSGTPVPVRPSELLGRDSEPVVLGQREIQAVSGDEAYRLRLLDELIGEEARDAVRKVAEAREELISNARAILEAERRREKLAGYPDRLKQIEHEIRLYEEQGLADKLRRHTDLLSDRRRLDHGTAKLDEAVQAWGEAADAVLDPLSSAEGTLRSAQSIQADILAEEAREIARVRTSMNRLLAEGRRVLDEAATRLTKVSRRWDEESKALEDELAALRRKLHSDVLDPDRLLRLTQERTSLQPALKELETASREVERLRRTRVGLVRAYRERRHAEHTLRRRMCDEVQKKLRDRLRLTVHFQGQTAEYERALTAAFRGSGVRDDAIAKLAASEGSDGPSLAEAVRAGAAEVEKRYHLSTAMAQKVVQWLTTDESRLLEVEALAPADSVSIELVVNGTPRPLSHLSVGQRATAILLLLFALKGRPLILDQPEDDLDNRFVFEDIVPLLREQKGLHPSGAGRQIVAATHNANIPVLGDAELVLTLEAAEDRARIVGRSSIDDAKIRSQIRGLLEGGKEAFRLRAEKYGGVS